MSPQECEISRGSPNQLLIKPNSPALVAEQFPFPHHTWKVAWLPLGNYRDSLRHKSQVYRNTNFSTGTRGKLHAPHIISRWELIICLWMKRWATFPQAPQEEFSLSNRCVRGTLCFLSQVEWTPRGLDSKEGRISLQSLKFRLIFHLTRWWHVWIPCRDPRESCSSPSHLDRGLTSLWPLERHTEFNAS